MSMSGSSSRLATLGQRSNSRQDLASPSFRNDVFVGGNGFQGDYQGGDVGGGGGGGGGYTYTNSYSRSSMHGGGASKGQISKGGGGTMK